MIHPYQGVRPRVHPTAFVHESAHVIGDVELGEDASVWFTTVIRGDVNQVRIGRATNVQDGTVIHVNRRGPATRLGSCVTVGHAARLHGCTIADRCLIGIGAIVLDGAELGEECLVAAGAVVPPGFVAPPRSLLMGAPAVVRRAVGTRELELIERSWANYVRLKNDYRLEA